MRSTRLGYVADLVFGWPFASDRFTTDATGRARVVRIRDLSGDDEAIYTDEVPGVEAHVIDGDVLVGMDGDFTVRTWGRGDALLNQRLCRVRPQEGHDGRFLGYALPPPLVEVGAVKYATTVKHLSAADLRQLPVPARPLAEQQVVADFLDRECVRIDCLQRSAFTLAQRLIEPALATFVARTEHLSSTQVGHHYDVRLGKMLDENAVVDGELVPYLRNQNVSWDSFDLSDVKMLRLTYADRRRYEVRPGDLLACEGRHVGKSAIWQGEIEPIYYQKALHRIRPLSSASNRFLMWCLWLGNTRGDYYADGTGSTIPHLPAEKLRRVRIPSATRDEQDAITRETDAAYDAAALAADAAARLRLRLAEYRQALIGDAVTGQLDIAAASDSQMDERAYAVAEGAAAADHTPTQVG